MNKCDHRSFAGSKYCTDETCDNYASRNLTAIGMERELLDWVSGSPGESDDLAMLDQRAFQGDPANSFMPDLIKQSDPELDRLLAEEEEIERQAEQRRLEQEQEINPASSEGWEIAYQTGPQGYAAGAEEE